MKNVLKVLSIIALAAVIGFTFLSCNSGGDSPTPTPTPEIPTPETPTPGNDPTSGSYSGRNEDALMTFELEISSQARAAVYKPKPNDNWTLAVTMEDEFGWSMTMEFKGKVQSVIGNIINLGKDPDKPFVENDIVVTIINGLMTKIIFQGGDYDLTPVGSTTPPTPPAGDRPAAVSGERYEYIFVNGSQNIFTVLKFGTGYIGTTTSGSETASYWAAGMTSAFTCTFTYSVLSGTVTLTWQSFGDWDGSYPTDNSHPERSARSQIKSVAEAASSNAATTTTTSFSI